MELADKNFQKVITHMVKHLKKYKNKEEKWKYEQEK